MQGRLLAAAECSIGGRAPHLTWVCWWRSHCRRMLRCSAAEPAPWWPPGLCSLPGRAARRGRLAAPAAWGSLQVAQQRYRPGGDQLTGSRFDTGTSQIRSANHSTAVFDYTSRILGREGGDIKYLYPLYGALENVKRNIWSCNETRVRKDYLHRKEQTDLDDGSLFVNVVGKWVRLRRAEKQTRAHNKIL